jgi:sec-independent protein translocase protein TatA
VVSCSLIFRRCPDMPSIGLPELILVAVIVLIFFGPGRLPELGSSMGKAVRGFRKSVSEPAEKEPKGPDGTGKPC